MNIPAGTAYSIRSQINDIRYDDSMISADYNWFYHGGYSWNDSPPITHSSTVVPARGSDNKIGYIAIVIYYEPVAATRTETIDHLTKDISFKITTPRQTTLPVSSSTPGTTPMTTFSIAQSSSSASSSSSSGSSTSSQSTVLSLLSPSNTSDTSSVTQSVGEISTLLPDLASVDLAFRSSQLPTLSTAAKAGAAVGSIVLVALLIFILLFFRWKQKKHAAMLLDDFETAPIAYPPEKHWRSSAFSSTLPPVNPSSSVTSIPEVSTSTPYAIPSVGPALSTRPSSHIPAASTPPPEELPLYATPMQPYARYTTPPTSLALAAFANANRDLISEDLELRLSVAGYLPSDDPDNLSEEEWMAVHNVTKLELMRLRSLFAATTVSSWLLDYGIQGHTLGAVGEVGLLIVRRTMAFSLALMIVLNPTFERIFTLVSLRLHRKHLKSLNSSPIGYEDFRASNQGFGDSGGPWETSTWSFRPLYTGSNIPAGGTYSIRTEINNIRYGDSVVATNYNQFYNGGHSWESSPTISHNGAVAVTRGVNSDTGYIGLMVYYEPVATTNNEYINHFIKGIDFKINTPVQNTAIIHSSSSAEVTSSASASISSRSLASFQSTSISSPLLSSLSGSPSVLQSGEAAHTASSAIVSQSDLVSQSSSAPKLSIAAQVGAALGSVALVALLIVIFLLLRSKRKRRAAKISEKHEIDQNSHPRTNDGRPTSSGEVPLVDMQFPVTFLPEISTPTPYTIPSSGPFSSTRPTSQESERSCDELPLYGAPRQSQAHYAVPPTSPPLAAFANANRELISEDLELRLSVAGYLPSDNPDNLSEEEWMSLHNVTKLELMRLRSLFTGSDVDSIYSLASARLRQIEASKAHASESV
ncbi:hypothetical protein M408DRAFT_9991 [Serendipita vermifera MAFF 305830]|uniref:Uncharacterized protein n=1 Tax=Serendipita vermifera MAFF 305830 TaxID=933852 RepID=A0A0C2XAC1_SERVB|nr:hypothetical protein M408DRAFT_9991 [Serendipita vermifera MAFF 305830]